MLFYPDDSFKSIAFRILEVTYSEDDIVTYVDLFVTNKNQILRDSRKDQSGQKEMYCIFPLWYWDP